MSGIVGFSINFPATQFFACGNKIIHLNHTQFILCGKGIGLGITLYFVWIRIIAVCVEIEKSGHAGQGHT